MLLALSLIACDATDTGSNPDDTSGGGSNLTAPPLVINEVLASNHVTQADNAGEFNDWVEIYNNGDTIVQLTGFYLTDDEAEPTVFAMPAGVGIDAGGFLAIWCDGQPEQTTGTEYHTPFKLNRKGDKVYLNYAEGNELVTVDSVYWESEQTPDLAAARVPDGTGAFALQAPTFEASNGG
jgi:hypothetical protein